MICGMSRYLAHTTPSAVDSQVRFNSSRRKPGRASQMVSVTGLSITNSTIGKIAKLCARMITLRQIGRRTWTIRGMGNCLMIASAWMKLVQPSVNAVEMNPKG